MQAGAELHLKILLLIILGNKKGKGGPEKVKPVLSFTRAKEFVVRMKWRA